MNNSPPSETPKNPHRPLDLDLKLAPKVQVIKQSASHAVSPSAQAPHRRGKKLLRRAILAMAIIILILGGIAVNRALGLSRKIFVGSKTTFYQQVREFIRGSLGSARLISENLGQVNILLLGVGGEGHDGPFLSDTIILSQIKPDIQSASLVSIPRDYLTDLPALGYRKINNAFAEGYARNKNFDEGGAWARQAAEKVSGVKIPYFAVIDFKGFTQAVNLIGGLDINVERTFTDYSYPDEKNDYLPPVTFTSGPQYMDGARALQFARSRHAAGPEGNDFARSQRQQKILEAFKQKILRLNLIADSKKINQLLEIFANHFHTNIGPGELYRLYSLSKKIDRANITSGSLDPQTGLICPQILPDNGAYILVLCPGKTEADVQNFFKNSFVLGKLALEKSTVWLANSTADAQAGKRAEDLLKDAGLNVYQIKFTDSQLSQSLLYQINQKPASAEFIKNQLHATEISLPPPGFKLDPGKVDIVVILGK